MPVNRWKIRWKGADGAMEEEFFSQGIEFNFRVPDLERGDVMPPLRAARGRRLNVTLTTGSDSTVLRLAQFACHAYGEGPGRSRSGPIYISIAYL